MLFIFHVMFLKHTEIHPGVIKGDIAYCGGRNKKKRFMFNFQKNLSFQSLVRIARTHIVLAVSIM